MHFNDPVTFTGTAVGFWHVPNIVQSTYFRQRLFVNVPRLSKVETEQLCRCFVCYQLSDQPQFFTGDDVACASAGYHMVSSGLWRECISFGCMTRTRWFIVHLPAAEKDSIIVPRSWSDDDFWSSGGGMES
jgi:hypothetical protein